MATNFGWMRVDALVLLTFLLATTVALASPAGTPGAPAGTTSKPKPEVPRSEKTRALKVVNVYAGDEAGHARRVFFTVEPAVFFYAMLAPRAAAEIAHERSFYLSVRDSMGREVARLGGMLPPELDLVRADLPRDCVGSPPNGLQVAGTALAERPGPYRAQAFLDGIPAGQAAFRIKSLRGPGEVKVTSAVVENSDGARRFLFTSKDRGVYAHVTLVNATRTQPHDHLLQVAFIGPEGRVGRLLGGVIVLEKGTRLDGRDFPVLCDPEHHDGMRIEGTEVAGQMGDWRMVVYLDGRIVREVPFRIVPPTP